MSQPSPELISNILKAFDAVFGLHPGFRPAHAKGIFCAGTFTPGPAADTLTSAPHATRPSTPVIVRFSNSTGIPTIPDLDPHASPRGIAVRFMLADHVHTDIIAHSQNGFPVRTGEEFLEFLTAVANSPPTAPHPNAIEKFLGSHPPALHFVTAPKPPAASFTREKYFAANAWHFVNAQGDTQFGRFKILPADGTEYLSPEEAAKESPNYLFEEIPARLAKSPATMKLLVQLAAPGDVVDDSTNVWPDSRPELEFGTFTLTKKLDENDPELKKIIFDPIPRVDGILPSRDPLIEVRSELYILSGRRRRAAGAAK
jgi:catalase